jgi:hypothetical protein
MPVVVIRKKPLPNWDVLTYTIGPSTTSLVNSDVKGPSRKFSKPVQFLIVWTISSNSCEKAYRLSARDGAAFPISFYGRGPGNPS